MDTQCESEKGESEGVTVKLKGDVLEKVLKERAKRERETKRAFSISEVVKEMVLRWGK